MKKILIKILSCALCLCLLCSSLAGCKEGKWDSTKMNNWGDVLSVGGFVAETQNYIYYLNGVSNNSEDNDFGAPVKGSLMVADKADLSKTEIAVPKLFGATDYSAGLYIFGDYVYYGTPSTDKTPDGTVAKSEMMFRRAKLDGSSDEHILTVNVLSAEYRIVENNGKVYIVYYDNANTSLVSYNVQDKKSTVIAKTDEKTEGNESLATYFFLENEMIGKAVVLYTTTVYSLPYNAEMNEGTGGSRPTEAYNRVYAYVAGSESKLVYDGCVKNGDNVVEENTYAILGVDKNYAYIKKTEEFGKETAYAVTANELVAKDKYSTVGVEVLEEYVGSTGNLVIDIDSVYILPVSEEEETAGPVKIYKDTLKVKDGSQKVDHAKTKQLVAICESVHALITVHKDYLYYYNTELVIYRIDLTAGEDAVEERVSEGAAASLSAWYAPEIVTIGGKDYLFYCDSSASGLAYVKYVDLATKATAEDADDDGEDDTFYLEGAKFLGKILDADRVKMMQVKVNGLGDALAENGNLVFDTDENGDYVKVNGKTVLKVSAVEEVRAEYNALPSSIKEEVDVTVLTNQERAIEIANLLYKLDGIYKIGDYAEDSSEYKAFKSAYESIKPAIEKYYNDGEYTTIGTLIENNLKANYTKAQSVFEPKE